MKAANDNIPLRIRKALASYVREPKNIKIHAYNAGMSRQNFYSWIKKVLGGPINKKEYQYNLFD